MSNPARAIFHRDGTLTFWSIRDQKWRYRVPASDIDSGHLMTFKPDVRERILERVRKDQPAQPETRAAS